MLHEELKTLKFWKLTFFAHFCRVLAAETNNKKIH